MRDAGVLQGRRRSMRNGAKGHARCRFSAAVQVSRSQTAPFFAQFVTMDAGTLSQEVISSVPP